MYIPLDHNSIVPLHQQAEEWLRQLIRGKKYQSGHPIPPEVQLAQQLNISRNTLRQAISKLVFEGLLVRKKRRGTCVSENKTTNSSTLRLPQQFTETGTGNYNFEMHVCYAVPSHTSALLFGIDNATKLVRLERLSGTMNAPTAYTIAEFNPALPVSVSENLNRPVADILKKEYDLDIKKIQEELHAVIADLFLATKLDIAPGAPLQVRKRYLYVANDSPAVFETVYHKADTFTYTIEHLCP